MRPAAVFLRIVGASGALVFAFLFLLTFWRPVWVETFAAGFIKSEVASEIDTRIDGLGLGGASAALSKISAAIYQKNQQQIDRYKADLKSRAHERLADAITQMLDLNCECRARIARVLENGAVDGITSLTAINEKLVDFIQGNYLRVVAELKHDLRIFTATNSICFVLLLLTTFLRPQAMAQLMLPGMLLLVATLYCSYAYVFNQNWLLTIIYSDYLGVAYAAYLALAFLFLCDVVLNHARVTTRLANAALSSVGSVLHLSPC